MSKEQSTIVVYEINGSTRRFPVPFEYLSRQFVVVTVLGAGRTVLTLGSDYRFVSLNEIETTVAYGGADGNLFIEIRRVTSATDRLVEFSDGSVLRSRDMNVSAIQTIHIAEEARNLASDTLASDDDGNLDARGRRLVNLGNAVNPKDAMTLEQVTGWSQSALNQANRSQTEANNSAASAVAALASQNAAAASQSAAKTSETNAKTSETNAKTSETNAKTSENAAAAERVLTETARNVTTNARDTILAIELTANAANASAIASKNAAAASESAAKTSETNAKTSETNAKTSEIAANAARDRAEAAKDIIENTEITSLANAQSALASKDAAAISETNAKDSELAALQYRNEASSFVPDSHLLKTSNLSDVEDKAASRTNLGLGTAATENVGSAVGKVKRYGDEPLNATTTDNMNTLNQNGVFYAAGSGVLNRPTWAEFSAVKWFSIGAPNAWESQLAFGAYNTAMALRARQSSAGAWLPWSRIFGHLDRASYVDVEIRSDKRDKSNLETLKNPLDSIEKLTGYTYLLDTQDGAKESAGVIAQDVLKVLPTAVGISTNHNEEERYTVNYNSLTALLVEAVKELSAEVKHLKGVINNGSK